MPTDIILYAVIAGGLFLWLRSLLGETHGEERKRPNPFDEHEKQAGKDSASQGKEPDPIPHLDNAEINVKFDEKDSYTPALDPAILAKIDDKGIEKSLFQISLADKSFNLAEFIENATEAFVMIINAYSEGNRATLEDMLAQHVYEPFIEAIEDREARGETVEMEVHAVRKADIRKAWMDGKMAHIAIRFVATETAVIKNKDGKILSGNPDIVSEKIDVWTFGRNTKSGDPRWFLYETAMDDDVHLYEEYRSPEAIAASKD